MTKRPTPAGRRSVAEYAPDIRREQNSSDTADTAPFNPLDTRNLGIAVVRALLDKRAHPLDSVPKFRGAGIYAIYYRGPFGAYEAIARRSATTDAQHVPIYVGKAIPPGGRKGGFTASPSDTSALVDRLREHAESIQATRNLEIGDFDCRFLVVHDLWIPLAEQLLISHFAPLWNTLIDGFGNHDPGKGRYGGLRPRWDVLHPGRAWVDRCAPRPETAADVAREAEQYLRSASPPMRSALEIT